MCTCVIRIYIYTYIYMYITSMHAYTHVPHSSLFSAPRRYIVYPGQQYWLAWWGDGMRWRPQANPHRCLPALQCRLYLGFLEKPCSSFCNMNHMNPGSYWHRCCYSVSGRRMVRGTSEMRIFIKCQCTTWHDCMHGRRWVFSVFVWERERESESLSERERASSKWGSLINYNSVCIDISNMVATQILIQNSRIFQDFPGQNSRKRIKSRIIKEPLYWIIADATTVYH